MENVAPIVASVAVQKFGAGPEAIAKGIATAENLPGWVHQLNPFLVQFTEHIGVRWYGLAYLTGFFVGYMIMALIARRGLIAADGTRSLPEERLGDYLLAVVLGTMLGGRVGYALFYSQDLLTDFSANFPFWGVLRVWEGGMASHGGMLGIILAAVYFARKNKFDWMNLGDLTTLGGSLGIAAGRIANFMNGELFGRPIESATSFGAKWAVKFPTEAFLWLKHDAEKSISDSSPDLLPRLANAANAVGVDSAHWLDIAAKVRTSSSARVEIQNVIQKIIAATEAHAQAVVDALQPALTARHPYQLYGALLEGLLLFFIAAFAWRKPQKPGVVGGIWLTSYAVVRIVTEQFRMPDAHIGYQLLGLTRGQWLSVGMLIGSIAILAYALKRGKPKIGGWAKRS
jgi:phosphatidylglycerol:prolipoprotein diacylglycerol transferase